MALGFALYNFITRAVAHVQTALVRPSFAAFGRKSVIFGPVRLAGPAHISIGQGVYVGSGCWLQGGTEPGAVNHDPHVPLQIGNRVSISGRATLSAVRSVQIGDNVLIAAGVHICDHTHEIRGNEAVRDQGITGISPITIGDGAWIGQNSVIMPGVTIGAGSVVGANSVVTKDVAARSIAAGTPARFLRFVDDDTKQKSLAKQDAVLSNERVVR